MKEDESTGQLQGKIDLVSKTGGIKLEANDKWYNPASDAVKEYVGKLNKGDEVTLEIKGGKVTYVKTENKTFQQDNIQQDRPRMSNEEYFEMRGERAKLGLDKALEIAGFKSIKDIESEIQSKIVISLFIQIVGK